MTDLEIKVAELEDANKRLAKENLSLRHHSGTLELENLELKSRLGQLDVEGATVKIDAESRSAALAVPPQKECLQNLSRWMTHSATYAMMWR